ncbi:MAG: rhamnulokinase [Lachnospiraceae bacterium]|nr:rhamnulokinase [Lachnospiraceae bacterium]
MKTYYLAIDIGASSGRHILGSMEDGKMVLEEIYRFPNGMIERDGHLVWDTEELFREVMAGIRKCKELGKIPRYVGLDTWGVDYVLLNADGEMIGPAYGYRDTRNDGMEEEVFSRVPEKELYYRTGIQRIKFNTVFQLMADRLQVPERLEKAETFLMIPDYFNYLLTGKACVEYTAASTTELLDPEAKDWDRELIRRLGYPEKIFGEIGLPGTVLGPFSEKTAEEAGFSSEVILVASHDTGSAVAAVPSNEDTVYISSGTWSLMGVERAEADCSEKSRLLNFTNEGGYEYRFRYLKNIMGLWMIQSVRKELKAQGLDLSYDEICKGAAKETISSIVPVNDDRFMMPASMIEEIKACLRESGQEVPESPYAVAAVVYNSLAMCYKETIEGIEEITGKKYDHINVVGGGSNAAYLNEVTANTTGRTVYAGPGEATAIGNMAVQMIRDGVFKSLSEARRCIYDSFGIGVFRPEV